MDAFSNQPPVSDRLALDHEHLKDEINAALAALPDVHIASDADILAARELVLSLKALQNRVAAAFKREKAFFLDGGRQVDQFFKALRVGLDATVGAITANVSSFQEEKLAAAREQAASEARIASFMDEPAPAAPAAAAMTRVSDDNGAVAVSGAIRWSHEVVDIDALPRTLLQPNEVAIRAKIAGLKASGATITDAADAIPGVKIFERISPTFR